MVAHLDHLLAVLDGIHGRLRQQHFALARVNVHLLRAEGVVPHVAHVVPVPEQTISSIDSLVFSSPVEALARLADSPDDAVLHGIIDFEHGAQLAGVVAHHQVLRGRTESVGGLHGRHLHAHAGDTTRGRTKLTAMHSKWLKEAPHSKERELKHTERLPRGFGFTYRHISIFL